MNRAPIATAMLALLSATAARAATFTVHDVRSAREIGEVTRLYVDDRLAASFVLDAATPELTATVQVAANVGPEGRDRHSYALCGTITIRSAMGGEEVHEVNASGLLYNPDRQSFEALGAADFNLFYLSDPADPDAVEVIRQRSGLCRTPIS